MYISFKRKLLLLALLLSANLSSQPRLYIQTNKDIYETGEDLWFSAWQLDGENLCLLDEDKTLYLQMSDARDSIVWQQKYPFEQGVSNGHLYVGDTLRAGNYYLEAYSRSSSISEPFRRKVRVVKRRKEIITDNPVWQLNDSIRMEFFPEGGYLTSNLPGYLAFKASSMDGKPVSVEGQLLSDAGTPIAFKSIHDGMGVIGFIPQKGNSYKVRLSNGQEYPIPEIRQEGMNLHYAGIQNGTARFIVTQTEGLPSRKISLSCKMNGKLCCSANGVLNRQLLMRIPLSEFHYQGIVEVTLYDDSNTPVAERLIYVNSEKRLHVSIEPDKETYGLRDKVDVRVTVKDGEGNPVPNALLCMSVFDKIYSDKGYLNVLAYAYLSPYLRGRINNPLFYFEEENDNRLQCLDLLLQVQGWRRYVQEKSEKQLTDEITGVLSLHSKKKSDVLQKEQLLLVQGANGGNHFVSCDSSGFFSVPVDVMKALQGGYVYLKPMPSDEYKPQITLDDGFKLLDSLRTNRDSTEQLEGVSYMVNLPDNDSFIMPEDSDAIMLDEVTVTSKGKRQFEDKFMGRLDSLIAMNVGQPYVCACGFLHNYLPEYDDHPWWRPCPHPEVRNRPVEGKTYEISKYTYCATDGNGIIFDLDRKRIIYHGPLYSEEEMLRMNNIYRIKGYYVKREFYQPDEVDIQQSLPDYRNALYWNPSLYTNENGEASVSFYCSDISSSFVIRAESIVKKGNWIGIVKNKISVLER